MTDEQEPEPQAQQQAAAVAPREIPPITLPPGILDGIIAALLPKILEAIIQAIMNMFRPPTTEPPGTVAPPIIINPPVGPPVAVQPPAPGEPARPVESWLQAGITTIYHNWFKGNVDQNVPAGQSTPHETELVRQGLMGLPPGARVQISADPMPFGCIEFPWPALEITERGADGTVKTYTLTRENPQPDDGPYWIQGGQTPSSIYWRSTGHHLILICPEPSQRSTLEIVFRASNGAVSNKFGAPWFIRGDGATRAAGASVMSAEAPPQAVVPVEREKLAPEPEGLYVREREFGWAKQ